MSIEAEQVCKFYEIIWNQHDKSLIPSVIDEQLVFKGSLGVETVGHDGFIDYLDDVHKALGAYICTIEDIVCEKSKVFVKMQFTGIHQGNLLGFSATGKQVAWHGSALFHFAGSKINSLWVLGDIKSLEEQLRG